MPGAPERTSLPPARPGLLELLALGAVTGGILGAGVRACLGPESSLAFLLYDDAYYYLQVARNLARGLGSTFDGINPTNGYHPLWCGMLVPIYWLTDTPGPALRAAGLLWFLLAAAAPVALWWALRPRTGAAGAVAAAALFALHPYIGMHLRRPNGLETPLLALLIALTIGMYERLAGGSHPLSRRRAAALGAVLGLAVLARMDAGFLAAAGAVLLAVHVARRDGRRAAVESLVLLVLCATLVAGPSMAWNTVRFGSPMPISGRAVAAWQEPRRAAMGGVLSPAFLRDRLATALDRLPRRMGRYAVEGTPLARPLWKSGKIGSLALLLAAGGLLAWALAIRRRRGRLTADALTLLAAFTALHYCAYAAWFWTGGEVIFRLYYLMPESMLLGAMAGTVLGHGLERLRPRWLRRAAAAAGLIGLAAYMLQVSGAHLRLMPQDRGPVSDSVIYGWLRRTLPGDAVLGATGAGRLGYFSGLPVVNLDGLINDDRYLAAIRADAIDDYVFASPITHLLGGRATLLGFDPHRPEQPPERREDLGEILYRLAAHHGCTLKKVPGPPGTWVVVEVRRPAR